ncbi:MAG: hypothetical protein ABIR30_14120 [Chitinophagaceae bacterium]
MKPQRPGIFIVVLILLLQAESFGQGKIAVKKLFERPQISLEKLPGTVSFRSKPSLSNYCFLLEAQRPADRKYISLRPISPSVYIDQLGFVCKKEYQLEKISSVPFRFRLGSLDYVNWLEQKPNAVKPGF